MKRKKAGTLQSAFPPFVWVISVNELPQRKRGLHPSPPPSLLLFTILKLNTHSDIRVHFFFNKVNKVKQIKMTLMIPGFHTVPVTRFSKILEAKK